MRCILSDTGEINLDLVLDLVRSILAEERADEQEPRVPCSSPELLRERLDLSLRAAGRPLADVVENLRQLLALTPKSCSRRFLNQLYGGRDGVATMAEIAAAVVNTQMHTFKVAGPQVLVELEVIKRMTRKVGYPDGEGLFTPGGSMANLVGMVLARNTAIETAREEGLQGERVTVYTSAESHYSIRKNMGILGLGRRNLRVVPVAGDGRMDVDQLRRLITEDLDAGARPLMINATAGTTVLGAFDTLRELAEVAAEHAIWLHVDGSYGATALLSEEHRQLLDGVEDSDSVTWSPHKAMNMPLLCSTILVKRKGLLDANFNESAGYLFQSATELDPGTRSIQCGRRNDSLKVWAAWQRYGDRGFSKRIGRQFKLAHTATRIIQADPDLQLTMKPQFINVCFEVKRKSSVEICELLAQQGHALVGHAEVAGRRVIRLVCVNPELTESDLMHFFQAVKDVAASLPDHSTDPHE